MVLVFKELCKLFPRRSTPGIEQKQVFLTVSKSLSRLSFSLHSLCCQMTNRQIIHSSTDLHQSFHADPF